MKNKKLTDRLEGWGVTLVLLLAGAATLFLLVQSVYLTTADTKGIDNATTKGLLMADSPWVHILLFAALLAASTAAQKIHWSEQGRARAKKLLKIGAVAVTVGVALFLVFLILDLKLAPEKDRLVVYQIAQMYLQGDYTELLPGGYLSTFQNQNGILTVDILALRLFGRNASQVLQLFNVVCFAAAAWVLGRVAQRMLHMASPALFAALFVVYLPMGLYVTFVYGTMPGLLLAAIQLLCTQRYCACHKARWGVLLAVCGALAALFKDNYLIFTVAAALYLLWDAVRLARWKSLLPLLLLAAVYLAGKELICYGIYDRAGLERQEGRPAVTWVAMALQDRPAMEGWCNDYMGEISDIYSEGGAQAAAEDAKASIRQSLQRFAQDPAGALTFFARKNSSQWNMPTGQTLSLLRGRDMDDSILPFWYSLLEVGGGLNRLYVGATNLFLTQLWAGALLYFVLNRKKMRLEQLLLAVIFLGGFLFHTAWEAKTQYVIVYIFLMLPYMLAGFALAGQRLLAVRGGAPRPSRPTAACACVILAALVLPGLTGNYGARTRQEAQDDLQSYRTLQANGASPVAAGSYLLLNGNGAYLSLDVGQEGSHALAVEGMQTAVQLQRPATLVLSMERNVCNLVVYDAAGQPLALGVNSYNDVQFLGMRGTPTAHEWTQRLTLTALEDGWCTVALVDADQNVELYLTADAASGEVLLLPYTGEANQQWQFVAA